LPPAKEKAAGRWDGLEGFATVAGLVRAGIADAVSPEARRTVYRRGAAWPKAGR
jgi:hypothetical protein